MRDLWNRPAFALSTVPFEHVCVDDFLPGPLFAELAATFPECPQATGPTGFTIHPGDAEFDALMRGSDAWHAFWQACDSQAFTDFMLRQFGECFAREAVVDLAHARHVHYVESRADKERRHLARVEHADDELWVRFDLMQGRVGYQRSVHVDHRRRAATMLLYFTDGDPPGAEGGELLLHGRAGAATKIAPRRNRLVMFACHNASWHSVSPIVRQREPRNFIQVTLSGSIDLWRPIAGGPVQRLRALVRKMTGQSRPSPVA